MAQKRISDLPVSTAFTGEELLEMSQLSTTVTIAADTISAAAADNSFSDSGSGFLTAGFQVNDRVNIVGFANGANNLFVGTLTIVTANKITIGGTDGDVIVDEAAGADVVISKWVSRRTSLDSVAKLSDGFHIMEVGTGASQDITLPLSGLEPESLLVFGNANYFPPDEYSVAGDQLTITSNAAGDDINIVYRGGGVAGGSSAPWYWAPPVVADFPTVIGAVAFSLTDDDDVGLRFYSAPISTDPFRGRCKALPAATDWTATMRIEHALNGVGFANLSMVALNAAMDKIGAFGWDSRFRAHYMHYTNLTYDGYEVLSIMASAPNWFRVSYVSATGILTYWISGDGKDWIALGSDNIKSYFSGVDPSYLGFAGENGSHPSPIAFSIQHWSDTL